MEKEDLNFKEKRAFCTITKGIIVLSVVYENFSVFTSYFVFSSFPNEAHFARLTFSNTIINQLFLYIVFLNLYMPPFTLIWFVLRKFNFFLHH